MFSLDLYLSICSETFFFKKKIVGFSGKCVLVIWFMKFFIFCDNGAGIGIAEEELLRFWGRVWWLCWYPKSSRSRRMPPLISFLFSFPISSKLFKFVLFFCFQFEVLEKF